MRIMSLQNINIKFITEPILNTGSNKSNNINIRIEIFQVFYLTFDLVVLIVGCNRLKATSIESVLFTWVLL